MDVDNSGAITHGNLRELLGNVSSDTLVTQMIEEADIKVRARAVNLPPSAWAPRPPSPPERRGP